MKQSPKRRLVQDWNPFEQEESLIHKLSEFNSAYIAFSSPYIEIPAFPNGDQQPIFQVGDIVDTTSCAEFKPGSGQWQILEIYKENGFYKHRAQLILTPDDIKKKCKTTVAIFRQQDIIKVSTLILKTTT